MDCRKRGFTKRLLVGKISPMPHPQPLVDRVVALASAGHTRSAIAAQVGLTRSAVCGLLHRLGIFTPAPARPPKPARPTRPYVRTAKASKPLPAVCEITDNPESPGVSWNDLARPHCRWPVDGDRWCGKVRTHGSYCGDHFALAYRPTVNLSKPLLSPSVFCPPRYHCASAFRAKDVDSV